MDLKSWCRSIATLGPVGYVFAPGTMATIVSAPMVLWLMSDRWPLLWLLSFVICSVFFSIACIKYVLPVFRENDPSEIVLDELVGCFFLFFNMSLTPYVFFVGIIIFRILDTLKLFGLSYVERIEGAWGIVLDDVCAGIMANLLLRIVLKFI